MQNQRGFIGVGLLIAILVGLAVLGGGAYYVVHQQSATQTPVENFDNVQTLPTTNTSTQTKNSVPQPKPITPATNNTANWKTYTNATYGYHIKYPSDWKASAASVVSNGKDQETWITHQDAAGSVDRKIVILAGVDSDGNLPYLRTTPATSQATLVGEAQTVYMFSKNPGCIDGSLSDKPCYASFIIPINHNGIWYELSASYGADAYTGTYKDILSTFGFANQGASNTTLVGTKD